MTSTPNDVPNDIANGPDGRKSNSSLHPAMTEDQFQAQHPEIKLKGH